MLVGEDAAARCSHLGTQLAGIVRVANDQAGGIGDAQHLIEGVVGVARDAGSVLHDLAIADRIVLEGDARVVRVAATQQLVGRIVAVSRGHVAGVETEHPVADRIVAERGDAPKGSVCARLSAGRVEGERGGIAAGIGQLDLLPTPS